DWRSLELKWQRRWAEARIFEANPEPGRPKCFVTFPYPYMNGLLHIGHAFTATRVDAYARFMRMRGYNVLFPWAWHWTGATIAGQCERLKRGDEEMIRIMVEVNKVPPEKLEELKDPVAMARYFTERGRVAVRRMGFSIDWRREFHTTSQHPHYNCFIRWQYAKLRELGYVVRGTHPVVWCPSCESPVGDHDRLEGEGVRPEEFTLLKFKLKGQDTYLVAATFRPETIFGATNLWLNPDVRYVEASVDGERWVIAPEAVPKLRDQGRSIEVLREFPGSELIGRSCVSPIDGRELPVLPGWFVDPGYATGVVFSVPAHAPYDYVALRDLKANPEMLKRFNIDPAILDGIKPISMIELEGYGDYPAIEVVEKMGIKDQHDPGLEEATSLIYKEEFHKGRLKPICGEYAGKLVKEVKAKLIEDLKAKGIADSMWELPAKVVCRCGTNCHVRLLQDQWFLRYSDPGWKERAKECVRQMKIYPEAARAWFLEVIDWYLDWPCAHKMGLGTPLPWDPDWLVETLSDSTIYMAFYTIMRAIREYDIGPEQLTEEVLDYVFLGRGDPEALAAKVGLSPDVLREMRDEFLYWYPVDLRNSAKELVPNHLTFFVFHHVAIWPRELWPRAIGVNGMVMIEGEKMSKRKGNFVPIEDAVEAYGADATRCALLLGAEGMDDPDWRADNVRAVKENLESFFNLALELANASGGEFGQPEKWLLSVLQARIKAVTSALEELRTRTALATAFYELWNDLRWYLRRRAGSPHGQTVREFLSTWVRLLAPFAPHVCEEIWERMGGEGFVSLAPWPEPDEAKVDLAVEEAEGLIRSLLEDAREIMRVLKVEKPKRICLYVASDWKWDAYLKVLEAARAGRPQLRELMRSLMSEPGMRARAKEVAELAKWALGDVLELSAEERERRWKVGKLDELAILRDAAGFLARELGAEEVLVFNEEDEARYDPANRARLAKPYRPAIYVE
ncbi:MAG TPA: leucine--tRNA ligase, partial [Candidatus Bathyarchaeota archaeon]|nr:leucine--tRNA ligase [Candidatus Bathyarchaeota archaeon]